MRVFLDECIDWRLSRDMPGHEVRTARQMGWTAIRNGELLVLAAREFDVFVTVDRNLAFQHDFGPLDLAVMILRAPSNRLSDLRPLVEPLLRSIESARVGTVTAIDGR